MANKQDLLNTFISSEDMILHAESEYDVDIVLVYVKQVGKHNFIVKACLKTNPNDEFQGEGVTKREALADCIASRFPD